MAQSGKGAACESDVTSHGTGQELNFDDDTLKGKDSYNYQQCITKWPLIQQTKDKQNNDKKSSFDNIQHTEVVKE